MRGRFTTKSILFTNVHVNVYFGSQKLACKRILVTVNVSQLQEIYMFLKIAACVSFTMLVHTCISLSQFQEIYVSKNSSVCLFLCLHC